MWCVGARRRRILAGTQAQQTRRISEGRSGLARREVGRRRRRLRLSRLRLVVWIRIANHKGHFQGRSLYARARALASWLRGYAQVQGGSAATPPRAAGALSDAPLGLLYAYTCLYLGWYGDHDGTGADAGYRAHTCVDCEIAFK